jgi:hypothetical protein
LPHDVLVRIFSFLPRGALAVTPGRVNREWAAAKAEAWAAACARPPPEKLVVLRPWHYNNKHYPADAPPLLPPWYMHEQFEAAASNNKLKKAIAVAAVYHGQVDVIEHLHARDGSLFLDIGPYACFMAALGGQLEVLASLREQGCEWEDDQMCRAAARGGSVPTLSWLCEQGCPCDAYTCSNAAAGGHLEALAFLRQNGAPFDASACSEAAKRGDMRTLAWLRENGCPWDWRTCDSAAAGGHFDLLIHAHENGAPLDVRTCSAAARRADLPMHGWRRGAARCMHASRPPNAATCACCKC